LRDKEEERGGEREREKGKGRRRTKIGGAKIGGHHHHHHHHIISMEEDTELEEGEAKEPCDPDTDFSYLVSYAIASSSSLFSSFSQLFLVAPPSSPCLCVCLSVSPGLLVLCVCVCVCLWFCFWFDDQFLILATSRGLN
jgi:hypothetical protein